MKKTISIFLTVLLILSTSIFASAANVRSFDETKMQDMVSYSETGAPIVNDPTATVSNVAKAGSVTVINTEDAWLYTNKRLNTGAFVIPKGKAIVVLETDSNYGSAKVTYAGYTGWVYSSKLDIA